VTPDSEWSADLAVVAVDTGDARPLPWAADGAESAPVRLGTAVFALANPGGRRRVTVGIVSAVNRAFRGPRGRVAQAGPGQRARASSPWWLPPSRRNAKSRRIRSQLTPIA
jgi:hypothetical protein